MSSEPTSPAPVENQRADATPPPLPASLPPKLNNNSSGGRAFLSFLLSLCFALFLADAFVSLADDALINLFGAHSLAGIRAVIFLFTVLMAFLVYCLMGITPVIPKRFFLPLTLFNPLALLLFVPLSIYFYTRLPQLALVISVCQVILALGLLFRFQRRLKFRWPLVPAGLLIGRGFSWRNLLGFLAVNLVVVLPAVIIYLLFCGRLALDHFTDGFMALRRDGLAVQVRKYVRDDGKTVQLFPMSHVADPAFYRKVTEAFPSNSVILMEGVTDEHNLLTNEISYDRMAKTLGVAEQHEEFTPVHGEWVAADVDVGQFSTNTIALLNMVMRLHSKGLTPENILEVTAYKPPAHFEEQLWDDLLTKRNEHVVREMNSRLATSDYIVIPWGAAHMAGIAREIQKLGFRLHETEEFLAIRFRFLDSKNHKKGAPSEKTK